MGRIADIGLLPAYLIPHAAALESSIDWTTSLKLVCTIRPLFSPGTYFITSSIAYSILPELEEESDEVQEDRLQKLASFQLMIIKHAMKCE